MILSASSALYYQHHPLFISVSSALYLRLKQRRKNISSRVRTRRPAGRNFQAPEHRARDRVRGCGRGQKETTDRLVGVRNLRRAAGEGKGGGGEALGTCGDGKRALRQSRRDP